MSAYEMVRTIRGSVQSFDHVDVARTRSSSQAALPPCSGCSQPSDAPFDDRHLESLRIGESVNTVFAGIAKKAEQMRSIG